MPTVATGAERRSHSTKGQLVEMFERAQVPHEVAVLPCGHYSSGKTPFKYWDGWVLTRFLTRALA